MPEKTHPRMNRIASRHRTLPTLILSAALFVTGTLHAQLPAGTTDTTAQPQTQQDPLRAQASEALAKQDYPTALKLLTTLAEKNPHDAQILYNLASTQEALDQPAAESTYRQAIAANPNLLEPHLALGLLLARSGKSSPARTELAAASIIPDGDPALRARAYRALARLDQQSNPSGASEELLAALKLSPETPDDILLSGELAEAANDPAAAESAYRRLLATDPQNSQATAALVHLLIQQKKPDQAEIILTAALAKNPDDPTLNSQLASLYQSQNKPDQALPILEKLHAAHPEDPNLARLLARLYSRSGQYDKADALYATLSTASPNDPTLLDDRADALIHLRNFAEAEALLKRALADPKAFPTSDDLGAAASHLAFAASANNDPTTTLQALEIRGRVLPQSPSSLFLAATAHDKLHQAKQATDLYKQFLSVANGQFPDEEWEARHRLIALEHTK
ncbi:tetratricopeptide repeat protein [Edaphobacter aggregans]|uniref:Tetratricopeptide repeat protein n=2 Tax=Edaphobacter aggregans TaxID=570835 RepID=A0A3R9NQR9_9BACT|nr:tetratricopeptide repeat protein [Edaphobacter aggregans]